MSHLNLQLEQLSVGRPTMTYSNWKENKGEHNHEPTDEYSGSFSIFSKADDKRVANFLQGKAWDGFVHR